MPKVCEACNNPGQHERRAERGSRLRNVLVGGRIVRLCEDHARRALEANVRDVAALMQLTRSDDDRRSPIDRRSPLNRRIFPPRPEGRRHSAARRSTDSD